jgi:Lambda phage tail tube protein, TTP
MPAVTPDTGLGAAITFSSGFMARMLSIEISGIERAELESTHMGTTGAAKTFVPADLYDPGEMTVEMHFDTDASPPITGAAETVTITWPDAETWACSGFLKSFAMNAPTEEFMTATAVIKFTGPWTF